MMEGLSSYEMSVLTRAKRRNIAQDGIIHSLSPENLRSYMALTGWTLQRILNISPVRCELVFLSQKTAFYIVTAVKTSNLT
jgi:hypothetical protein